MNALRSRLSVRLVLSHVAVAIVGVAVAYVVVHLRAPQLFDEATRGLGPRTGRGPGGGGGPGLGLRQVVSDAIDAALLLGLLLSALVAGLLAWIVSRHLLRPLEVVRRTTRSIAAGDYSARVASPPTAELARLADDVNLLAASLEASEQRRMRLIADVAHELRTPLTIVDGYVAGIRDGVFDVDDARLASISAEVDRMRRLTDDLSTLSRTEEGRLDLHVTDLDLAQVAALVVDRLAVQATERGITLRCRSGPVPARGDADRVAQILTNLVRNALQATPPGGTVDLTCATTPHGAVAEVRDAGRGLTPEDLHDVFERFHRITDPTQTTHGSGIGLTIARGLAHAMNATLTATSPGPGHGATFTLTLPTTGRNRSVSRNTPSHESQAPSPG